MSVYVVAATELATALRDSQRLVGGFLLCVCLFSPICEFYAQTFMSPKTCHVGVTNLKDLTPVSSTLSKRAKF